MNVLARYMTGIKSLDALYRREPFDEEEEDALMDELDDLWAKMNTAERAEAYSRAEQEDDA